MSLAALGAFAAAPGAFAKGLDELGQANPDAGEEAAEEPAEAEAPAAAEPAATPGAVSQAIADKLLMATSFGWVFASKSEGDWRSGGISDVTVGYRIMAVNAAMAVYGSYRYAPISVAGEQDGHSYRGVWETHYAGGRLTYKVNDKIRAIGSAELGYVLSYLRPVDGLPGVEDHESNGVSVALGGGADYALTERHAFTVGPRLYAAFGSFTSVQLGAAATFLF